MRARPMAARAAAPPCRHPAAGRPRRSRPGSSPSRGSSPACPHGRSTTWPRPSGSGGSSSGSASTNSFSRSPIHATKLEGWARARLRLPERHRHLTRATSAPARIRHIASSPSTPTSTRDAATERKRDVADARIPLDGHGLAVDSDPKYRTGQCPGDARGQPRVDLDRRVHRRSGYVRSTGSTAAHDRARDDARRRSARTGPDTAEIHDPGLLPSTSWVAWAPIVVSTESEYRGWVATTLGGHAPRGRPLLLERAVRLLQGSGRGRISP